MNDEYVLSVHNHKYKTFTQGAGGLGVGVLEVEERLYWDFSVLTGISEMSFM